MGETHASGYEAPKDESIDQAEEAPRPPRGTPEFYEWLDKKLNGTRTGEPTLEDAKRMGDAEFRGMTIFKRDNNLNGQDE